MHGSQAGPHRFVALTHDDAIERDAVLWESKSAYELYVSVANCPRAIMASFVKLFDGRTFSLPVVRRFVVGFVRRMGIDVFFRIPDSTDILWLLGASMSVKRFPRRAGCTKTII